jgi:CBS domain-containing protein
MGAHTKFAARATEGPAPRPSVRPPDRLGDFTADSRVVLLSFMAIIIGVLSAFVATALVWLINAVTEKVARRGYHVTREYSVSPLARLRVEDVMERDVPTLAADTPMETIATRLADRDPVLGRRYAWPWWAAPAL